jgi:pimeloyl-ACP methyl ester carboxylesterase
VDPARLALVGASVGSSIAIQYAAHDRSVDALVCLSPGVDYLGLDAVGDIRQVMGRKILMLAAEGERDAPYTLQKACPGVEVEICPGGAVVHGTNLLETVPALDERIADFLRRSVGEPSERIVVASIEKNIYHRPDSGWAAEISPTNLRYYSSPAEAEARGLRAAKSTGPSKKSGPRAARDAKSAADERR